MIPEGPSRASGSVPGLPPGVDPGAAREMAMLLAAAFATGVLDAALIRFHQRRLGHERETTEAILRELVDGSRAGSNRGPSA